MLNLLKNVKVTRVSAGAAAGQTAVSSSILDMEGFEGVLFIADLGDVDDTCVLTLTAQQNTVNSGTGMASLGSGATFTAGASDADDKQLAVDVFRPLERYVRAQLTRTTANAVLDGITAIQYRARKAPITQPAGMLATEVLTSPAEA